VSNEQWRKGKWTRLDWTRFFLHLPVGAIQIVAFLAGNGIGFAFLIMFIVYELNEDIVHLKDCAFKDIIGWLFGFVAGLIALIALRLLGVSLDAPG